MTDTHEVTASAPTEADAQRSGRMPSSWWDLLPVLILVLILVLVGVGLSGPADDRSDVEGTGEQTSREPGSGWSGDATIGDGADGGPSGVGRRRLRSVSTAVARPRVPDASDRESAPVSLVDPKDSAPAPQRVLRPTLRLFDADRETLGLVMADDDVAFATAVHLAEHTMPEGQLLTIGVVEPQGFRRLVPEITAQADAVWDALARGELVLSPHRAAALGLRAGAVVDLAGGDTAEIGGTASNGTPPLVDAIVAQSAELDLGETQRSLLVATRRGADIPAVAARLEAVTGLTPHAMPAAWPAEASLVGGDPRTVAAFGSFTFTPGRGGRITMDPAWEASNIVTAEVPILGEVRCHRLFLPQLRAALQQVVDRGLADLIDAGDYGGCYLARHIDWNPLASLSMHAWGIAVDINVATNGLGAQPQMDLRIVEVFEDHGFDWGGNWNRPDGMHFELARLLSPQQLEVLSDN